MADVRGSAAPGYVSKRPRDTMSSTGAQICNVGNIMTVWFLVLWLEKACRQELNLISVVKSVGNSGFHFKGCKRGNKNLRLHKQNLIKMRTWRHNNQLLKYFKLSEYYCQSCADSILCCKS